MGCVCRCCNVQQWDASVLAALKQDDVSIKIKLRPCQHTSEMMSAIYVCDESRSLRKNVWFTVHFHAVFEQWRRCFLWCAADVYRVYGRYFRTRNLIVSSFILFYAFNRRYIQVSYYLKRRFLKYRSHICIDVVAQPRRCLCDASAWGLSTLPQVGAVHVVVRGRGRVAVEGGVA